MQTINSDDKMMKLYRELKIYDDNYVTKKKTTARFLEKTKNKNSTLKKVLPK